MARKSFLAILVGAAALAAPSAFADQGGIPNDGSNGQGRPADQTTTSAQGKALAKGHAKAHAKAQAKAKGHAKANTQARGKALAKGHAKTQATAQAKTQGTPAANTHAKAGKTTICHATGSATNPFVTITISNNALPAHRRHQDGRDMIPAPAGGCPTGPAQGAPQQQGAATPPAGTQAPAGVTPSAGSQGQVLGESTTGSTSSPNEVSVLGASTSGKAPSASSSPSATGTEAASSSGLPFTGTDAIIVAILGLAAVLLGVTVRRATTNRA
jgi:hypothetical protein